MGFNNSYTYFTWRETKAELEQYARDLWHTEQAEYFRPSLWPNTPDILTESLARGGRPLHIARVVLAATMSPVYGLYGPPYEHAVARKHPSKEEYADNEKFEVRCWNWNDPTSLQPLLRRLNEIRRAHPALQQGRCISVVETGNDNLVAFAKWSGGDRVVVVVSLNPHYEESGTLSLDLATLGLDAYASYEATDVLGGVRHRWQGAHPYVRLTPEMPAHVFALRR